MDRLNQLRGAAGDSTLDITSPPSETFMTANESTSKYFSLSEVDSSFDISPIKDVSLASTTADSSTTITEDGLIPNLSPVRKKNDILDSYKIGKQIEAANILSGGVDIFDDNDNSYDGDELVIDDNIELDEKSNSEIKQQDPVEFKSEMIESTLVEGDADVASKDTEVVLQIDRKNVDAIDIGNGLYLYRKDGEEELAAVQIIDDEKQQPSFKFLKVRENAEGNLEVYEEIEVEVQKEVPAKEGKSTDINTSHVPIRDINKVINDNTSNKVADKNKISQEEQTTSSTYDVENECKEALESKSEVNLNGKMMKFNESRKSPVIGSFAYHSTPNKEGKPLTKTMVDLQLHPSRHSDNIKKTIEVHTDNCKQKIIENQIKHKDFIEEKGLHTLPTENDGTTILIDEKSENNINDGNKVNKSENISLKDNGVNTLNAINASISEDNEPAEIIEKHDQCNVSVNVCNKILDPGNLEIFDKDIVIDSAISNMSQSDNQEENTMKNHKHIERDDSVVIISKIDISQENILRNQASDVSTKKSETHKNCNITESSQEFSCSINEQTQDDKKQDNKIAQVEDHIIVNKMVPEENNSLDITEKSVPKYSEIINLNKDLKENNTVKNVTEVKDMFSESSNTCSKLFREDSKFKDDIVKAVDNDNNIHQNEVVKEVDKDISTEENDKNTLDQHKSNVCNKQNIESREIPLSNKSTIPLQFDIQNKNNDTNNCSQLTGTEKFVQSQDKSPREHEKSVQSQDKSPREHEKSVQSQERSPREHEKSVQSQERSPREHEKSVQSQDKSPREYEKSVQSQDRSPREHKKSVQSQDKLPREHEKSVQSQDRSPREHEKSVQSQDKSPRKYEKSVQSQDRSPREHEKSVQSQDKPPREYEKSVQSQERSPRGHEKSVQSQDKSPRQQKHFIIKSDEIVTSPIENSSSESKNIIQQKADKDAHVEDKDCIIKKVQEKLLEKVNKVNEIENVKTENVSELKSLKIMEETCVVESEVSAQIETKLELECNDSQKDIKINDDDSKSINSISAVPFGKWTEANRQEFLNKIKGTRTLVNSSNNKAIKNSNDLNRRDVLKKIDSQRHTSTASKVQDLSKINTKPETVFTNKPVIAIEESSVEPKMPNAIASLESKIPLKIGMSTSRSKEIIFKKSTKLESTRKPLVMPAKITATVTSVTKKESIQRKAVKDLIDKTIEGMIIKAFPSKPTSTETKASDCNVGNISTTPTTLDAIEMKMNELHGIPFIERPPHELPKVHNTVPQNYVQADLDKVSDNKATKVPKLLSSSNKNTQEQVNDHFLEVESEEEVIEHEPVTGDIEIKHDLPSNLSLNENPIKPDTLNTKKDSIITEKDFDKFARRNSVTYENCLTVNFDKQEPLNVVKTVIEMDKAPKNYSKNEILRIESKQNRPSKIQNLNLNKHPNKIYSSTKIGRVIEDSSNKNYHSKLQIAYQSALTAKRQLSCPIDIIEDQPVKVVFMDAKTDFVPNLLNIQGQELSPSDKKNVEDVNNIPTTDSMDSDLVNAVDEGKPQEDIKLKTKHQRKQVLTPVEAPELELIEPRDLGIDVSPKKKRKTEDNKADKNSKNVIHKKSYLLGRTIVEDKILKTQSLTNNESKSTFHRDKETVPKDTVTAIDSLVKAAEMLENQSENMNSSSMSNPESLPNTTPVKRGRGRPRKYPLPDATTDKTKVPSPQKKPRLIDAKQNKQDTEDEESSDEAAIKENWTMGKINENIVCPICNKLFRSENVIFKHVKHCSGPSPNRSDTSKRSARKGRSSQESDDRSHGSQDEMDVDDEKSYEDCEDVITGCKSKDRINKTEADKDVIVIEDTLTKEKSKKHSEEKHYDSKLGIKNKIQTVSSSNLECEFCGKTFRQLSYLANHKLQHKKENIKRIDKSSEIGNKSVLSCDICNKEFRKLHHLAQHRIIHNQNTIPTKLPRKISSEQIIDTTEKEETSKQSEDPSAGFRCEPCDKSFRKLHHLVEHRETHDGINRQKTTCPEQVPVEKTIPPPQCDICKKTFRKLHHLIEHKEQHVETSSEKSDDKSVKSSLSTKDIIHECSLCYMVFPNEHSLNKHTIICQRKKRLSKQPKPVNEEEPDTIEMDNLKVEENKIYDGDEPEVILDEVKVINLERDDDNSDIDTHTTDVIMQEEEHTHLADAAENHPPNVIEEKKIETQKERNNDTEVIISKVEHSIEIKENNDKTEANEIVYAENNSKKKILIKDKIASTVTKRQKKVSVALQTVDDDKPSEATSDEDEVRYMLNPDYKPDDTSDDKLFLKVKAKKRNSLQIERPNSKDLIKRRTSLQHPPKIPRLKSKPIENKIITAGTALIKNIPKNPKTKPTPSTDSDDSDVKYSFPVKTPKPIHERALKDKTEKRTQRKSLEEKRKSLSGIAKRKSLGKNPPRVKHSSVKQVKRRTADVEHRCDCGQLFSSAALLSRHTSLAHTPPRIRKRRSPPPDPDNKTLIKRTPRKSSDVTKQTVATRKSSVRSDASGSLSKSNRPAKPTTEVKSSDVRKSIKPADKEVELIKTNNNTSKLRRSGVHKGVPVPEKMRNLYKRGGSKK